MQQRQQQQYSARELNVDIEDAATTTTAATSWHKARAQWLQWGPQPESQRVMLMTRIVPRVIMVLNTHIEDASLSLGDCISWQTSLLCQHCTSALLQALVHQVFQDLNHWPIAFL